VLKELSFTNVGRYICSMLNKLKISVQKIMHLDKFNMLNAIYAEFGDMNLFSKQEK
jgi:hypothetical protein